jgi:class 3 adenylate cyclase
VLELIAVSMQHAARFHTDGNRPASRALEPERSTGAEHRSAKRIAVMTSWNPVLPPRCLRPRGDVPSYRKRAEPSGLLTQEGVVPRWARRDARGWDRVRPASIGGPMELPETRFAWNGDVALAYQSFGAGGRDLLYLPGVRSNVDVMWEEPSYERFLRRLATFARVLVIDRRGYGCSERFSADNVAPLEVLVDDLIVVLDTVGIERTALFAFQEANFLAAVLAASRPELVSHLILMDPSPSWLRNEELPWEWAAETWEGQIASYHDNWGVVSAERFAAEERSWIGHGSPPPDERYLRWEVKMERATMGPGTMVAETRKFMATDIRAVLPAIHVPTLVVRRRGNAVFDPRGVRYVADHVPEARYVEIDSPPDTSPWSGGWEALTDEIEDFIAGTRHGPEPERLLKTVLFTDIVGSSSTASHLGDGAWHELLRKHHRIVRDELVRFGGIEQDTGGDGFFAAFDGPARAVRCAQAISREVRSLGIEVRIGLHTGECEIVDGKVSGIAAITGARVMAQAVSSEILVSRTVKDLVAGSGLRFDDRDEHRLAGVEGMWRLYAVTT